MGNEGIMEEVFFELQNMGIEVKQDIELSKITSFRIGGKAKCAVYPKNEEELIFSVNLVCELDEKYAVVGNTSNMLFSDRAFDGIVIFTRKMNEINLMENGVIDCGCGAMLPMISRTALENGLGGFEFACGIPGTFGGAVFMNAGAHGGQMSDVVFKTKAYDPYEKKLHSISADQHGFDYRRSIYSETHGLICLGGSIALTPCDKDIVAENIRKNTVYRRSTQPLEYPSAGSFFKRPEGNFAAKLIDECGLKGYRIGGACVSEKHAGFIVNLGGATFDDVMKVAEHVRKTVFENTGIDLKREVELFNE